MEEQATFYLHKKGIKFWYLPSKGQRYYHRLDGPAVEWPDGTKEWWTDGKKHRIDGPAVEWSNGATAWWVDGKQHRLDGPAVELKHRTKKQRVNYKQCHEPAIEDINGTKEWWINDNELSAEEVETWLEENDVDLKTAEGRMAFKLRWM